MAIDLTGLRTELARNKMTQVELCRLISVRQPTISAMCNNKAKHIPINVLNKICRTLRCQPGDIMTYVPDESDVKNQTLPGSAG